MIIKQQSTLLRILFIDLDCHFIREKVNTSIIAPTFISTSQQLADIFTKALSRDQHWKLLSKLKVLNPCAPLACGGSDEHNADSQSLNHVHIQKQGHSSNYQAAAALSITNPMKHGIKASILHGLKYTGSASHNGGDFHIKWT